LAENLLALSWRSLAVSKNGAFMNLENIPIHWFDFAALIIILLGLSRGRKNGMSVELMAMLQWLAIIFAGAFLYRPLGDALCQASPVSHLFAYIMMYVTVAILVKIGFATVKKLTGGKLMGSNVFGRAEYYLGMVAGAIRFACILIAGMSLLNAPTYTPADLARAKAYQIEMYGSAFFPGFGSVQHEVFKESLLGSAFKNYASFMLISPTKTEKRDFEKRKIEGF
jgi:uncharacterized membrane protein required for colicin V production